MASKMRLKKELEMLSLSPPTGISCVPSNDRLDVLFAQIIGASGTPYDGGVFDLEITIPSRYPFDPPSIKFLTPIYHPNIDTSGRICLDTLKLPPKGSWRPCLNISTVLMMIRVLMAEPGSEDPLMADIWQEFRYDYTTYVEKAKQHTELHASKGKVCGERGNTNRSSGTVVEPREQTESASNSTFPKSKPVASLSTLTSNRQYPSSSTADPGCDNSMANVGIKRKREDNKAAEEYSDFKENVSAPSTKTKSKIRIANK